MGHFYYAAKAFDILERLDSDNEYEDALRGSIVGNRLSLFKRRISNGYRAKRDHGSFIRGHKYVIGRRIESLGRIYDESYKIMG